MASINDVYNQLVTVNATLAQIGADVNNDTTATNAVKASVDQLDQDLNAGFSHANSSLDAAVQALRAIWTIDLQSAALLTHLTQQADTMICALEHISQNTCGMLTQSTIQTGLQAAIRADADDLLAIAKSAYPAGAVELARFAALQEEIHQCCPPVTPPAACNYEPCPKPRPIADKPLPQPPERGSKPN